MRIVLNVLRHVLLWLLGVALGVAVLLGAVMAASYAFTTSGSLPAPDTQFGGAALTVNGSRWRVPLVGGMLDKAFYSPSTLSVEKLGVLYEAHPEITLPEWATYATLRITADGMGDAAYFDGPVEDYAAFLYPANGEYKAELTVWRLPVGMTDVGFGQPADGAVLPGGQLVQQAVNPGGQLQHALPAPKTVGKVELGQRESGAVAGRALVAAKSLLPQADVYGQGQACLGGDQLGGLPGPHQGRAQDAGDALLPGGQLPAQGAGLFPAAVGQGNVGHAADLVLDVPDRFAVAGEVDVLHGWYLHFKKPGSVLPGLGYMRFSRGRPVTAARPAGCRRWWW